jgi:hypothetical protein
LSRAWLGIAFVPLSRLYLSLFLYVCYNCYDNVLYIIHVSSYNVYLYFVYILSIARLSSCSSISSCSTRSSVYGVSGRHCVSMVLIRCLPMDAPYILGHVVDYKRDTHVESFVVHSLNIGQVGSSYEGRQALFLIFLSNIPYV